MAYRKFDRRRQYNGNGEDKNYNCPQCDSPMKKRWGKFGPFYGCTSYPACRGMRKANGEEIKPKTGIVKIPRPNFKANEEQLAILRQLEESVINGDCHVMVKACAGTGKTATQIWSLFELFDAGLMKGLDFSMVAYNSAIKDENRQKCPKGLESDCQTSHSVGYDAIQKVCRILVNKPDQFKTADIIESIIEDQSDDAEMRGTIKALVSAAKNSALLPCDIAGITAAIEDFDIDVPEEETDKIVGYVSKVLSASLPKLAKVEKPTNSEDKAKLAQPGDLRGKFLLSVDFDDMLWLPCVCPAIKAALKRCNMIFGDEVQDFNRAQLEICRTMLKGGVALMVGDPNQAIYGFRGAAPEAFEDLRTILEIEKKVVDLPLTVNQRCDRAIIEYAQRIVPEIQAAPGKPRGVVDMELTLEDVFETVRPGDAVLCRVNAPLFKVALRLARKGTPVGFLGKHKIEAQLVSLVDRVTQQRKGQRYCNDVGEMISRLQEYLDELQEKFGGKRGGEFIIDKNRDMVECIEAIAIDCQTVGNLKQKVSQLFVSKEQIEKRRGEYVTFSSMHSSKGLQWGRVFIIEMGLLPHPLAKSDRQEQQEKNLEYVAVTRAEHELYGTFDSVKEMTEI